MKKLLTALLVFSSVVVFAQQEPYYTHFKYNKQAYNPAAAGEHVNHICIVGVTHYQWRQFDDLSAYRGTDVGTDIPEVKKEDQNVAPETHNVNLSYLFGVGKAGNSFIGTGLSITDDNVGVTKNTTIHVDLNFRRQFQGGFRELALGVGLGFQQFGIVNPQFKWKDPGDPLIPSTSVNDGKFNMNAGVMFKQQRLGPLKDFYAGLSVTQLNAPQYQLGAYYRDFIPHVYTIVGADYDMGAIVIEPAILIKYSTGLVLSQSYLPQVDLHATALYANTFRGGLAFRQWASTDALSILLGYKKDALEIGYSYDLTMTSINSVSAGTHEVMVKYCIPITVPKKTKIQRLTPRFM